MLKLIKINRLQDSLEVTNPKLTQTQTPIEIPISIKSHHSFFLRLKGLMFRKGPLAQEGIWLSPCNSIHMFFMRFPIDVVFLDREQRIVQVAEDVQPWKVIPPVKEAHSVLELPTGTLKHYTFQTGDLIEIG